MSTVFSDPDNEFDYNKLTNVDSVTVTRNPLVDHEVSDKNMLMMK